MGRMNSMLVLVTSLFIILTPLESEARNLLSRNEELQGHLKRFNKPPVKSIQSPDGDMIDCIKIQEQPAFDHPLLKNHVIQMRPSFEAEGEIKKSKNVMSQLWHTTNETCPQGTVPIRRVKEEDLLRAHSLQHFGKKHTTIPSSSHHNILATTPPPNHEFAIIEESGEKYYGTEATMSAWEPFVEQPKESSSSQFWLASGSYDKDNLNTIEAGWKVHPSLYGDTKARFFIYWTKDGYLHTGCHDLLCPGFVQTSTKIVVGATILNPVSKYGGPMYDFNLQVLKDEKEGKWWLKFANLNEVVGYWPSELFTSLSESAERVQWGGEVINLGANGKHTGTDMGSGHFAEEGAGKASFVMRIQVADSTRKFRKGKIDGTGVDHPTCYNLIYGDSHEMDVHFFYGGPGNNPNCA